jgi:hypothetical protein
MSEYSLWILVRGSHDPEKKANAIAELERRAGLGQLVSQGRVAKIVSGEIRKDGTPRD